MIKENNNGRPLLNIILHPFVTSLKATFLVKICINRSFDPTGCYLFQIKALNKKLILAIGGKDVRQTDLLLQ